jgi:hypothetical protein
MGRGAADEILFGPTHPKCHPKPADLIAPAALSDDLAGAVARAQRELRIPPDASAIEEVATLLSAEEGAPAPSEPETLGRAIEKHAASIAAADEDYIQRLLTAPGYRRWQRLTNQIKLAPLVAWGLVFAEQVDLNGRSGLGLRAAVEDELARSRGTRPNRPL